MRELYAFRLKIFFGYVCLCFTTDELLSLPVHVLTAMIMFSNF
jgi:hypothetical protein